MKKFQAHMLVRKLAKKRAAREKREENKRKKQQEKMRLAAVEKEAPQCSTLERLAEAAVELQKRRVRDATCVLGSESCATTLKLDSTVKK